MISSPRLALAFAEDALALADFAEKNGFPEDAMRVREFAAKVRAELPHSRRWESKVAS